MRTRLDTEARSVSEQAAEWLLILEDPCDEERVAFANWLAKSPLHVGAFLRASAVDSLLDGTDLGDQDISLESGDTSVVDIGSGSNAPVRQVVRVAPRRPPSLAWRWAAAASIAVIALAVGAAVLAQRFTGDSWKHYSTAVGEQRMLELEDGSTLFLSPGSHVAVQFLADQRQLRLDAGEAMFKVRHDAARPFRVHAGRTVIQAIGTQFSVGRVRDESVVSVLEGVVQISQERTLLQTIVAPVTGRESAKANAVRVTAGQETRIDGDGAVASPAPAEVDRAKMWRDRRLTFINETLFAIAEQFNRYNRAPRIVIQDAAAGERRYAAAFNSNDPESLLAVLEHDPNLAIERIGDEIIIRTR